jgi:hypothetical protein
MEPQSAFVWTESRVELDSITAIDLWLSLVILPHDTKLDYAFWNRDDLQGGLVFRMLFEERAVFEGRDEFCQALSVLAPQLRAVGTDAALDEPLYACSNSGSDGRFDMIAIVCGISFLLGDGQCSSSRNGVCGGGGGKRELGDSFFYVCCA